MKNKQEQYVITEERPQNAHREDLWNFLLLGLLRQTNFALKTLPSNFTVPPNF